ncbi:MAG: TetR/AcrR family transcriptional regulator [Bacteroidota bacterium]|nr:TetR/AcrR family transcriptional regulator [Bacteroidota bacterium]
MLSKRQEQIIEESVRIIDEKGIQGFTIKNLSKAIGISEPAIYRHFESKFQILVEILDGFNNKMRHFEQQFINNNDSAIEKIEKIYQGHFAFFLENPAIISVIFAEEIFNNDKSLYNKINEILQINENMILKIIGEGQINGEIKNEVDKNQITIIVMASLRLIVKKWKLSSFAFDLKKEGQKLFESIKILIKK